MCVRESNDYTMKVKVKYLIQCNVCHDQCMCILSYLSFYSRPQGVQQLLPTAYIRVLVPSKQEKESTKGNKITVAEQSR